MYLTFHLGIEDYIKYNEFHFKTRSNFWARNSALILFLFFVGYLIFQHKDDLNEGIQNWGNWAILIFGGAYFYYMDNRKVKSRKKHAESLVKENPYLIGRQEITFLDDKVLAVTESTKHEFLYDIFTSVEEDNDLIYVFMNKNNAFLIPKRDIKSEEFLNFIKNKIKVN